MPTASRLFLAAVGLSVPLAAGASSLHAQAADTTRLGPVVVTATRVPARVGATGASVTILDGDDLRARGITRLADALREVPSAAVVPTGQPGTVTSVFLRGGESRYAKVLVDGVPLNAPGGAFDWSQLTLDNVERIEVVRGPASVEWGSDAVSGVVHVITRAGGRRPSVHASLRAGTVGAPAGAPGDRALAAREIAVEGQRPLGDWRLSAGAAARRNDGIAPFNGRWRNDAYSLALRSGPGAATEVAVTARVVDAATGVATDGGGAFADRNAFRTERRLVAGLDVGRALGTVAGTGIAGRLSLGTNEVRATDDNQPDGPADTTGFYSRTTTTASRRVAEARLVATLAPGTTATIGLEGQWQGELGVGTAQFGRTPLGGTRFDQRRRTVGVHAGFVAAAVGPATLNSGVRLDRNSVFGTFVTTRHAVSMALGEATRARAAFGTAYREPAFTEQFTTAYTRGNPGLVPEQVRSAEVGITHEVAGIATVGATWFDQGFRNLIQYVGRAAPAPNYDNLARASARGLEFEAGLDPTALALVARGGVTVLETRVREAGTGASGTFVTGQSLLRRPRVQATATLGWRFRRLGTLLVTGQHIGSRDDQDFSAFPSRRVTLPAVRRYDVSWELPARGAFPGCSVRVDNVTGVRYQQVFGFDQPGRAVMLGVRW